MAEINQFCTEPITCYAQSGSSERLALSPNNNLVHIYRQQNSTWIEESVLNQHDLRVTSIDWAPKTNRIVTCSADRNAYVWLQSPGDSAWKPTLVLLRINRAATCVKWSPNEEKFAVGTAARLVCICYFESANDWWVSRHIKKPIKSTVTCIDWHPNNVLLACGSTDYKSRIFSTFIKEVEQKTDGLAKLKASSWLKNSDLQIDDQAISTTGTLINEFSNSGSWVHDVAFSLDGSKLAWVSHDSSISIVDSQHSMTVVTLKTRYLPFLSCVWVSERSIIAAGHDCCPMLFNHQLATTTPNSNGVQQQQQQQQPQKPLTQQLPVLKFVGRLDRSQKRSEDGQSAMRKFRDLDAKADNHHSLNSAGGDSCLSTIHQNTIGQIRLYSKSKSVATVGLDGKFVVWSLDPSVL